MKIETKNTHAYTQIHTYTHDWNASWKTLNGPPFGAQVLTHTETDKHTHTHQLHVFFTNRSFIFSSICFHFST